jgi:rod shape-determining protein MreC
VRGSRRVRLTFVLLLLTAFTLTALDYNTSKTGPLAALRNGVDTVFGPVQRVVGSAASSVGNALGGLPRLGSYQSDNAKLEQENDKLRGQIASLAGLQCQIDQLNGLMHFTTFTKYEQIPAHVVAVGPTSAFEWTATLDVGSIDGVKPAMTVVAYNGLVGRTLNVTKHSTQVLLLADPAFQVGGTLIGQSALGVASGHGSRPMTYSLANARSAVRKGDVLLTTGSDTYAPGVPIGTVTSVAPDTNAISRTAKIAPFVDVSALDLVGVVTNPGRTAPRVPLRPQGVGPKPTSTPCPSAVNHGPVPTASPSATASPKASVTSSPSASASTRSTRTATPTATRSRTPSPTPSPSTQPSPTRSPTRSPSSSPSP